MLSGLCSISSGIIVSLLQEKYGFSYSFSGILLSIMSIGNMAACFVSGILPEKIGQKKSVAVLCSGYFSGYLLMAFFGSPGILAAAFLLTGIAKGSAINNCTVLVGNNSVNRTKALSLMHACYATGAMVCPFVITAFMYVNRNLPMSGIAFCGLLMWLVFMTAGLSKKASDSSKKGESDFMRAYERLLNYVKVYTTSDPVSDTHPTTARQFDLARMLVKELQDLGLADAHVDEHCYVYATLPATPGHEAAKGLGFIAHMDTSPDAPGENVKPQIHENYDGGDVVLPGTGAVLSTRQFPFLAKLKGQTLITTDGTTLLGADDKAGVAEIMTMLEILQKENRPHGKICVGFTPDEEVGQGADLFDVEHFGAAYAYTVDGDEAGEISYENFNAAAAFVTVHGFSVHPGSAKNAMKNAQNIAIEFHNALPYYDRPEYTENREGFYHLCSMEGDVTGAKLGYIVRDHSAESFAARKETMRHIAKLLNEKYGEGTVELELKDSYFSMLEKIKPHFHLVENARAAIRKAGLEPLETPIRGGTDGATLSYMGLPCPNLGTGGFNYHGPCEGITVEAMDKATEILLNLADIYKDVQ